MKQTAFTLLCYFWPFCVCSREQAGLPLLFVLPHTHKSACCARAHILLFLAVLGRKSAHQAQLPYTNIVFSLSYILSLTHKILWKTVLLNTFGLVSSNQTASGTWVLSLTNSLMLASSESTRPSHSALVVCGRHHHYQRRLDVQTLGWSPPRHSNLRSQTILLR